jgi:hypothetical protein
LNRWPDSGILIGRGRLRGIDQRLREKRSIFVNDVAARRLACAEGSAAHHRQQGERQTQARNANLPHIEVA